MSQSTPINLLRRTGDTSSTPNFSMDNSDMPQNQISQQGTPQFAQQFTPQSSESQLVEDILKEMGDSPGNEQQSNINAQALQYAMDSAQVPAYKYTGQNEQMQPTQPYNNYSEKIMNQQVDLNSNFLSQIGINLNGESLKEKLIKNIKYPMLVFFISFLISLPEFNRFLFGFFPRLLLESGQVSIGGVLLKGVVGMLVFCAVALFL